MVWISPLIGSSNLFILLEPCSGPEATAVCSELTGCILSHPPLIFRSSYSLLLLCFFHPGVQRPGVAEKQQQQQQRHGAFNDHAQHTVWITTLLNALRCRSDSQRGDSVWWRRLQYRCTLRFRTLGSFLISVFDSIISSSIHDVFKCC